MAIIVATANTFVRLRRTFFIEMISLRPLPFSLADVCARFGAQARIVLQVCQPESGTASPLFLTFALRKISTNIRARAVLGIAPARFLRVSIIPEALARQYASTSPESALSWGSSVKGGPHGKHVDGVCNNYRRYRDRNVRQSRRRPKCRQDRASTDPNHHAQNPANSDRRREGRAGNARRRITHSEARVRPAARRRSHPWLRRGRRQY